MPQHCYNSHSCIHVMVTLVCKTVYEILRPTFTSRVGCGCWRRSFTLPKWFTTDCCNAVYNYVFMCIRMYVYVNVYYIIMCTVCKCSTWSFSMQLCTTPLCASQPVKHAALYFSSAKICSLWFHFCGLCMLWLLLIAAHNAFLPLKC